VRVFHESGFVLRRVGDKDAGVLRAVPSNGADWYRNSVAFDEVLCALRHKDFILCLVTSGRDKRYFLDYDECVQTISCCGVGGAATAEPDIHDWRITSSIPLELQRGQRLKAIEKHLQGEAMFLAITRWLSNVNLQP